MKHWITRLFYGLLFAIPLVLISFALVQAAPPAQTTDIQPSDCKACHPAFQSAWENGAHAKAAQPVTCESCHGMANSGHPDSPMGMNKSPQLCGNCHKDAFFEWQISGHGSKNVVCSDCHDPHATSLKAETPIALCGTCHSERSSTFTHTAHSQQGLTCPDCHLEMGSQAMQDGWKYDHTFQVRLETCSKCHKDDLHSVVPPAMASGGETPTKPDAMAAVNQTVSSTPSPVSPLGFSVFAGLIGLGMGVVLAPWLERRVRHVLSIGR